MSGNEKTLSVANCCRCGRIIDTREKSEGGDDFGCELTDGRWTCSHECWEAVTDPDVSAIASAGGGEVVAWHCVGSGDGWHEDKIIRDIETAEDCANSEKWTVRALVYATPPAPAAPGAGLVEAAELLRLTRHHRNEIGHYTGFDFVQRLETLLTALPPAPAEERRVAGEESPQQPHPTDPGHWRWRGDR